MCGRITQTDSPITYAQMLGWRGFDPQDLHEGPTADYNAAPGSLHWTLRMLEDERPFIEPVMWHYLSKWAAQEGHSPAINARLDKLLTPYYRSLMKHGRIIVPANGWYEWVGEKGSKQPWHIRAKSGEPLLFAALTNHFPDKPDPEGAGFIIATDDAAGGMIDVHDRRPIALTPEDARLWMDLATPYEQAEQIARTTTVREDFFEWYPVSKDVNRAGNNTPDLIEPLKEEP